MIGDRAYDDWKMMADEYGLDLTDETVVKTIVAFEDTEMRRKGIAGASTLARDVLTRAVLLKARGEDERKLMEVCTDVVKGLK